MASRTIEQDNDRRLTIMTATFIPCGAKLPVIALMGGVIAGGGRICRKFLHRTAYVPYRDCGSAYFAIILKKTKMFSGKPAPFVMELPQYHAAGKDSSSSWMGETERIHDQAGTILFLACIVMWFLEDGFSDGKFGIVRQCQ